MDKGSALRLKLSTELTKPQIQAPPLAPPIMSQLIFLVRALPTVSRLSLLA